MLRRAADLAEDAPQIHLAHLAAQADIAALDWPGDTDLLVCGGTARPDEDRRLAGLYARGGARNVTASQPLTAFLLNADYSKALTLYTMTSSVAGDYQSLLDRLDAWLAVNKPANLEVTHAGTPVIWTGVLHEITRGQVLSFTLATLVVTLMMMLWLKSVRLGLLGMLTLLTTSVTLYGCMFLLKIQLNIGTTLVTFLVVGVVDYAVHLLSRIKLLMQQGMDVDPAILQAMHSVGRSTVVNVVIFSVGFLALLFSDFKPIVDLGALVALALFTSGVMTVLVVALISPWFFGAIVAERDRRVAAAPASLDGLAPLPG